MTYRTPICRATRSVSLSARAPQWLIAGLVCWCSALSTANAQDLLINPSFSLGGQLFGWNVTSGRAEWDNRDILDSQLSGSVRGNHLVAGNNGSRIVITQCVEIGLEGRYDFGVWTFAESGQGDGIFGGRAILYAYIESSTCSGSPDVTSFSPTVTIRDNWVLTQGALEVPEGVQSVRLNFAIFKVNGVEHDAIVYFDDAFLLPPDQVFADRFE